jgi:hypothetical protein
VLRGCDTIKPKVESPQPVNMAVTTESVSAIESRAQVDRILQSRIFRTSEVLRHLFAYLADKSIEGAADTLKEYTIGLDALGKPASFDPRQESVVRMHTARLRQKLAEYYRTEGATDPVIVDMPKGGFRVTFEARPQVTSAPLTAVQPEPAAPKGFPETPARPWQRREIVLAGALAVAVLCAVLAMARLSRAEQGRSDAGDQTAAAAPAATWTPALRELWEPLLSSSRRLVVCVATPMFVKVPGFGLIREPSVNDWDDVSGSKKISSIEEALQAGISEPSYSYTEVGTATGAFLLGQFLAPRKQAVLITRANVLSWPEIAEDNVIFLGPATGIHQTEDLPMEAQLRLDPSGIHNLHPRTGEPSFIPDHPAESGAEGGESYALISRLPAMNGPGAILMLSGNQTSSVMGGVQAFTNPTLAQTLVSRLKSGSGSMPKYFQVVLRVKAMDDVPVQVSYMFHRDLFDHGQRPASKE